MKRTIRIKEPYWGAWKEFGWVKGTWGIGLNEKVLFQTEGSWLRIYSEYHKTSYLINLAESMEKARLCKNKPRGVKLYVIPMDILRPEVESANSKVVAESGQPEEQKKKIQKAGRKDSQPELFR